MKDRTAQFMVTQIAQMWAPADQWPEGAKLSASATSHFPYAISRLCKENSWFKSAVGPLAGRASVDFAQWKQAAVSAATECAQSASCA